MAAIGLRTTVESELLSFAEEIIAGDLTFASWLSTEIARFHRKLVPTPAKLWLSHPHLSSFKTP